MAWAKLSLRVGLWVKGRCVRAARCVHRTVRCESGQGTTEYAILVGVIVLMAILAITLFRPRLQELWNAIAEGINGL